MIRSMHLKLTSTLSAFVCGLTLSALCPAAVAQVGADLPRSTVEAISISGSQQTQMNDFVQAWTARAISDDAQENKRALEALTKPLSGRGVSVAFRQGYTQALSPLMSEFDNQKSVGAKISALRLAGDLATPSAATRIESALADDDLGVRLFAVASAGRVFTTTTRNGQAMTPEAAYALIGAVRELAGEDGIDPELLRAAVRALSAGTRLSSRDMGDARSRSIIALSEVVGARLRALSTKDDPAFAQSLALDAASAATASISDISAAITPGAVKAAVGLGGDTISVALRRVLGNTIRPVTDRELTVSSVQAGETLLYFALRKHAELNNTPATGVRQTGFATQLKSGDDRAFRNDASKLLGPGSDIVRMFGFDDERFLR